VFRLNFHSYLAGVQGGLDETCREKQFDMKTIPICPADLEHWRSTRFLRLGFGKGFIWFDFDG
jgi:hypothetical protein